MSGSFYCEGFSLVHVIITTIINQHLLLAEETALNFLWKKLCFCNFWTDNPSYTAFLEKKDTWLEFNVVEGTFVVAYKLDVINVCFFFFVKFCEILLKSVFGGCANKIFIL